MCQNALLRPEAGLVHDQQNDAVHKPDDCLLSFYNRRTVTTKYCTKGEERYTVQYMA